MFIESAIAAKLGTLNGDSLTLAKAGEILSSDEAVSENGDHSEVDEQEDGTSPESAIDTQQEMSETSRNSTQNHSGEGTSSRPDKPTVALSLTVDATSDPEKLEKQLKLLRQYGVI